jgi:hypothetical protein
MEYAKELSNRGEISLEKSNNNEHREHSLNNRDDLNHSYSTRRKNKEKNKRKVNKNHLSLKYGIFLFTLWLTFMASFIMGFIVHYDIPNKVNAASIIWTFSGVLFIISMCYTYLYHKAKKCYNSDSLRDYLKYFPI